MTSVYAFKVGNRTFIDISLRQLISVNTIDPAGCIHGLSPCLAVEYSIKCIKTDKLLLSSSCEVIVDLPAER